jgi:hypothetical protein
MRFVVGVMHLTATLGLTAALGLTATAALGAGCFHTDEDDIYVAPAPYDLSVPPGPTDLAARRDDGGGTTTNLGSGRARPADSTPLHVNAGGSVTVPDGQYGFTVTANGQGGYRVAWVDATGAGLRYHGSIFIHGSYSQVSSTGMNYATANGERLDFESQPGAGQLGYVDFVSSSDPITVDVLAGAQLGTLYYDDVNDVTQTILTPATFTSP